MKKVDFSNKLPDISSVFSNFNFVVLGSVFVLLLIVSIAFGNSVYDSMEQAEAAKQKTAQMEKYISVWLEKSEMVNNAPMHPVKPEDLDKVQTILLTSLNQYNLNITSFKSENPQHQSSQNENIDDENQDSKAKQKTNFHDYEISIEGSYYDTVNFLNSIHQNKMLISIRSLRLEQQKGIIKSDIKYRVYIM